MDVIAELSGRDQPSCREAAIEGRLPRGIGVTRMVVFFANMIFAFVRKAPAGANPWGPGATTLEWTLPSPPPFHQFDTLPRVTGPSLGDATR